jgi:hypothetical protein
MHTTRNVAAIALALTVVCTGCSTVRAADCEHLIAQHMVGEALLAAHLVAFATLGHA